MTPAVSAVLFDLDGVIRHWDDAGTRAGEAAAGLPPGAIERVAYDVPEFALAQVGQVTAAEWGAAIGRALVAAHGPGAEVAAELFMAHTGVLDIAMVELVAAVRQHVTVALLSNATDQLRAHLAHHELTEAFDLVLCSAELGVAKPDPGIFRHAATVLGRKPAECFFTDDRPENVDGARAAGLRAAVFTTRDGLVTDLRGLGLPL